MYHFYRKPQYNKETCESLWQAAIGDSHDSYCGCCKAFTHLLSLFIPPDHKYYNYTVKQIIEEETKDSICLFGGKEEKDGSPEENIHTGADAGDIQENPGEEDKGPTIEELIAAAEAAETR